MKNVESYPQILQLETLWPSGNFTAAALLAIRAEDVARKVGRALHVGNEPGLGEWRAIGLKLGSGAHVELIEYLHQPVKGFVLRIDSGCEVKTVLDEILALLGLGPEAVLWRSGSILLQRGK